MKSLLGRFLCSLIGVIPILTLPLAARAQLGGTPVAPVSNPCPRTVTAGGVVQNPPALFSSNGVLNVEFTYQTTTDEFGRGLWCLTTPAGLQEPTLFLNPGDTLNITVTNNTPASPLGEVYNPPNCGNTQVEETGDGIGSALNIHFHGTNTTPQCGGDNVVRTIINSGSTFKYSVLIPSNEPPGLYWYHPHIHGIAERDIQGGAAGVIVVQGIQNIQPAVAGLQQQILVVRDQPTIQGLPESGPPVNSNVETPNLDLTLNYIPENATTNTTTGVTTFTPAVLDMQPGQKQFWRICNCTSDTILNLELLFNGTPQTFQVVAIDGVPVNSQDGVQPGSTIPTTSYVVPPAARVEIIATAPTSTSTSAQLVTTFINNGPLGDEDPTRALFNIHLTSATTAAADSIAGDSIPASTGVVTTQQLFGGLSNATVEATHQLNFQEVSDGSAFFINIDTQPYAENTPFDPNNPPAIMIQQGSVQEWTIANEAMENHEFHQHQIHFKVLSQNNFPNVIGSQPVPAINGQFLDMVQVPFWNGNSKTPFPSVSMLMDFRGMDIGDFVFHCHILGHEDLGMMAIEQVNAAPPSTAEIKDNKTPALADRIPNSLRLPRVTETVVSTGAGADGRGNE